jgi:hypothetical protein
LTLCNIVSGLKNPDNGFGKIILTKISQITKKRELFPVCFGEYEGFLIIVQVAFSAAPAMAAG